MWKWIVGAALLVVVVIGGTCWYGVHKLLQGGSAATVTLAATPDHVFALIADRDSMLLWMDKGSRPSNGHGLLAVGDTARVDSGSANGRNGMPRQSAWVVREVVPGKLLASAILDSASRVAFMRRDSVVAAGDSTTLISTFSMPGIDSLRVARGDTSRAAATVSRLLLSTLRLRAEMDDNSLQAYLGRKPAANH